MAARAADGIGGTGGRAAIELAARGTRCRRRRARGPRPRRAAPRGATRRPRRRRACPRPRRSHRAPRRARPRGAPARGARRGRGAPPPGARASPPRGGRRARLVEVRLHGVAFRFGPLQPRAEGRPDPRRLAAALRRVAAVAVARALDLRAPPFQRRLVARPRGAQPLVAQRRPRRASLRRGERLAQLAILGRQPRHGAPRRRERREGLPIQSLDLGGEGRRLGGAGGAAPGGRRAHRCHV